jgi:3-phosphoshikimate 1-carboxyvinyltransferase
VEVGRQVLPRMIDEVPVLAVLATQAEGETVIRDAHELRVKESDRIAAMATALTALGADVESLADGLVIRGPTPLKGAEVDSVGDHRVALALAVAGLVTPDKVRVKGWSCVEVSFPEFLDVLGRAQGKRA